MLDELMRIGVELRFEKARKCLQAAEAMIAIEAFADSANRSYYSIFHAMQALLTTGGFSSKTHSGSIAEFRKKYIKTGIFPKQYSDILRDAFQVRNKSDYDIYYIVVKSEVVQQIENAKIFLSGIETYIKALMDIVDYEKTQAKLTLMSEIAKGEKAGRENGWLTIEEVEFGDSLQNED